MTDVKVLEFVNLVLNSTHSYLPAIYTFDYYKFSYYYYTLPYHYYYVMIFVIFVTFIIYFKVNTMKW